LKEKLFENVIEAKGVEEFPYQFNTLLHAAA
jgi:hypothetical protein